MDLDLVEVRGGSRLRLRVKPGARRNAILGPHGGALKLSVTAAPEKGKANEAVIALLARSLAVPASALSLVSGQTSPDKTVFVPLSPGAIVERLAKKH